MFIVTHYMINERLYHKARDRAVEAESFHLALFAKIPRLKKCKTKGSDGQPSMYIQLFRDRLSEKLCTRQCRKVIWDMIDTLFLTTVAVESTFVAFR